MADWEVALEKQVATWAFLNSPTGAQFIEGYRKSEIDSDPTNAGVNSHLHSNLTSALWNADPIYVTRDMMNLLEAAWPMWEPEIFREEDVFLPYGFVYLPRPVYLKDVRGLRVAHRAIAWMPAKRSEDNKPATYVSTWSDIGDNDDYLLHESEEDLSKLRRFFRRAMALNYASPMIYGMTAREMLDPGFEERAAHYDMGTMPLKERLGKVGGADAITESTMSLLSFLQCLWRLLGQQVAVGFKERPTRAQRRQLERDRFPEKYITVVTLRRPRRPTQDDDLRPVEWSQRWVVSGHWRWQPYKDGVRQIWIAPYVKGPEDKPLVVRGARVFRWAR